MYSTRATNSQKIDLRMMFLINLTFKGQYSFVVFSIIYSSFFYIVLQSAVKQECYNPIMFYVTRNIQTEVYFTHHDIEKAGSDAEVLKRLRQKVEGYCDQEYGFIIQVVGGEAGFSIEKIEVKKEGLFAKLKFNCITFRPSKNEMMPVVVTEVSQGSILGRVGPAHVMIPQMKMAEQGLRFRPQDSAYELLSPDSDQMRTIKAGSVIFCRCFEMRVEMNSIMRVIGTVDSALLQILFSRQETD